MTDPVPVAGKVNRQERRLDPRILYSGSRLIVLVLLCIILTVALAVLTKHDQRTRYLLVAAVFCLAAAGFITRFANQPINAVVITWSPQAPAANWAELRDTWWFWHVLRTIAGVAALALALLAALGAHRRSE